MARDKDLIVDNQADSEDENYNEAEDDDFNPAQEGAEDDVSSSEDEDQANPPKSNKRKADIASDLDSGDEATIKERKSKRRRQQAADDDSGNEGGLVKTRSQHQAEKAQRRQARHRIDGDITIDVDQAWAELQAIPIGQSHSLYLDVSHDAADEYEDMKPSEYITIKRRIKFAGQITEVDEEVLRDSDEARRYLAEQEEDKKEQAENSGGDRVNRPLRRISRFEPNPLGIVKGVAPEKLRRKAPSRIDLVMAERRAEEEKRKKAEKLTTMQKTALDWKGFVIEQGLGDELNEYGKSKKGFLAREQFLDKVHGAKEVARRTARLKV